MQLVLIFMAFVGCFALAQKATRRLGDAAPAIAKTMAALGAVGWVAGAVLQLVKYGAVTAPCC